MSQDQALRHECIEMLGALSHDELRVIGVQLRRMIRIGRGKYGPLDLSRERRDWDKEKALESADRMFYESCADVARAERKRERIERFVFAVDSDSCDHRRGDSGWKPDVDIPLNDRGKQTNPPSLTASRESGAETVGGDRTFYAGHCGTCKQPIDGREHTNCSWDDWILP